MPRKAGQAKPRRARRAVAGRVVFGEGESLTMSEDVFCDYCCRRTGKKA